MTTNLDRLHKVVTKEITGRGCGKTFARCHEVAGFIELGHRTIFCMTSLNRDFLYIKPMIEEVLNEHGIRINKISTQPFKIYTNVGATIFFIPENLLEQKTRGYRDIVQVDMRHWS